MFDSGHIDRVLEIARYRIYAVHAYVWISWYVHSVNSAECRQGLSNMQCKRVYSANDKSPTALSLCVPDRWGFPLLSFFCTWWSKLLIKV